MAYEPKPFVIKTPYPTLEETRKKLGVSKKDLSEIERVVRESLAKQKSEDAKRTVSVWFIVLTPEESAELLRAYNEHKRRHPKKPRKKLLRSGKSV